MLIHMEKNLFFNRLNLLLLLVMIQIFLPCDSIVFAAKQPFPSAIIKLPENETAILVEKKSQILFLYTSRANELFVQFQVPCSTGEVSGVKQKAGDKKTPEGVYFLKDEYEDKYLSPIYGKKAFPLDYPNFIDKRSGKNGSAIWIHGTKKILKPMDSNGCIALENSNVIKLSDYVALNSTPVIIVEEIDTIDREIIGEQEKKVDIMLDQWLQTIEEGSYHDYLSFYSSEYLPDISWWEQWLETRKRIHKPGLTLKIERSRTGIYYHNHVFVVLFDCFLTFENKKKMLGKIKLFLKNQNNTYKIMGDVFQYIPQELQRSSVFPLIAAAETLIKSVLEKDAVTESIQQWLAAWSMKDMNKYALFYADNFFSDGMNKKQWVRRKQILAKKYDFINVSGESFDIKSKEKTCEVTFYQEYEASGFTAYGIKRLKLVNKGGLWKIYQESWKKK